MKHRAIIFGFLCFVLFLVICCVFLFKVVIGAEINKPKTIILCFDDGPRPAVLKELLPLLKKYKVPGTFFVMGWAVPQNKELVKKMHNAGHEIENHSWGHENSVEWFKKKGAEGIKSSLLKTDEAIFKVTGRHPRFFRPRSWEITEEIEKIIISLDYKVMKRDDPDINTEDYLDTEKRHPPEILVKRVKKYIAEREAKGKLEHVLVFHELPLTVEALKTLIPYFQNQGYKFARLDEK